jgi:hypothetical protein
MSNRTFQKSHHWRIAWRETLILLDEFRRPVLTFTIAIIGLGIIYYSIARQAGEPLSSLPEAVYSMLTLAFFSTQRQFSTRFYSSNLLIPDAGHRPNHPGTGVGRARRHAFLPPGAL